MSKAPFGKIIARCYEDLADTIEAGPQTDAEFFHQVLEIVFVELNFKAKLMAEGIKACKSAASKWINRVATPTPPSRKTVFAWIVTALRQAAVRAQ